MSERENTLDSKAQNEFNLRSRNTGLDKTDIRILKLLYADARISRAEISRSIGLSAPSVTERVRRLEESGVIKGYGVRIDPALLGFNLTVLIRARPLPGKMNNMIEVIRNTPQIVACDRVSGEDCFVARAHIRDVAEMETVIDRLVPYGATNSSIVQSSPVEERMIDLKTGSNENTGTT